MKEEIIEYHPNSKINHKISFYDNGNKFFEQNFGQGAPTYQQWYENGITYNKTNYVHGFCHNICNPSDIYFTRNGKIWGKFYYLNNNNYSKLNWMNCIKNI